MFEITFCGAAGKNKENTMKKRLKIGFNESSKAVTADVTIEWELNQDDTLKYEQALKEVETLFEQAQRYAIEKTMRTKV